VLLRSAVREVEFSSKQLHAEQSKDYNEQEEEKEQTGNGSDRVH